MKGLQINDTQRAKDKVRGWLKENRSRRVLKFYNTYYGDKSSPTLRTIQRILFDAKYPDHHGVWINASEYYRGKKESEEALNDRIKKSVEL